MKTRLLILIALLTLSAANSHGIGRTGNKSAHGIDVGDFQDGFIATVPNEYSYVESMGQDNLRMKANGMIPDSFGIPPAIELLRLVSIYPEFKGLHRDDIKNKLFADQWTSIPSSDSCVDLFYLTDSNTVAGLALWGDEKGLLIRAIDGKLNRKAVQTVLSTLQLDPGACAWK